ncbi:hypothetical protein P5G51_001740 [Virgibacillus sp. 179-BFC.A HS]|uniref:YqzM family protein n=1 Tax=Tigheibacillus jepli TaxID=3035914 RepID=A0ABU5CFK8_9BACI|nr:hypothetical protein [Virgibacillus sp. 179-BFC.A HS]MDY0404305.1 hypothetical protein [Virgibacillus sp. 179-BFC.A HS]
MRKEDENKKDKENDSFDRMFLGSPGMMFTLVAVVIVISFLVNYFK